MKLVAYYHVYLTDDYGTWSSIVMEQLKLMQDAGLLDELHELRINCITQNDGRESKFIDLLNSLGLFNKTKLMLVLNPYANDDEMLANINSDKTITENLTMRRMWHDSQTEDMHLLYIHTKGITSVINALRKGDTYRYSVYYYWRQFLNWGVIEKWKTCINNLHFNDIAGVNYKTEPSRHFSGGFWWANSSYIRKLPDPSTLDWWNELKAKTENHWLKHASDRFRDEQWPCIDDKVRVYNVHTPKDIDPAGDILPRSVYKNEEELMWHPV